MATIDPKKFVAIEIRASGRRCAVDCSYHCTYLPDIHECSLFCVRLNSDAKSRPIRATACRKAEAQLTTKSGQSNG
jgi:hypothetical protein